jgi:hypothetical protein
VSIESVLNVAIPLLALTGTLPDRVPPDGLVPMAIVTVALLVVTVWGIASAGFRNT